MLKQITGSMLDCLMFQKSIFLLGNLQHSLFAWQVWAGSQNFAHSSLLAGIMTILALHNGPLIPMTSFLWQEMIQAAKSVELAEESTDL